MKKHWTKKIKEENNRLLADIDKILKGDFETALKYKMHFKAVYDNNEMIWYGESTLSKS